MTKPGRSAAIGVALLLAACGDPSSPSNSDASSAAAGGKPSGSIASILDLGTLGGAASAAYGLNDNGQIVGESRTRAGSQHAFVWSNGVMADLGVLAGAAHSVAYDINEAGVIVGASGFRPVRWLPTAGGGYGTAQDLGSLGGCCGDAQAINDGGQITGFSGHVIAHQPPTPPDTAGHAYLWQSGEMSDIHPLTLFGESDQTFPWAINNSGTVVGQQFEPSRGFYRHSDGSAQLLAGIGGAGSVPIDINNAGTIVGWSQATASNQPWRATLWSNGVPQDLGTLGGPSSVAIAISDDLSPRVVGRADTGRGQRAFVWTQGAGMKDLGLPKGHSFGQAWDINGSGWIVGETSSPSGQPRATLWKLAAP